MRQGVAEVKKELAAALERRVTATVERLALWDDALFEKVRRECAEECAAARRPLFKLTITGDKERMGGVVARVHQIVDGHAADATVKVRDDSAEFDHISRTCLSHCGGVYPHVACRVTALHRVHNASAERAFLEGGARLGRAVRWGYHGAPAAALEKICREGLKPQGGDTAAATEEGWFGDGREGVYCSGPFDHSLQYSRKAHDGSIAQAVAPGQTLRFAMVRLRPGRELLVRRRDGMRPSDAHDSRATQLGVHEEGAVPTSGAGARRGGPRRGGFNAQVVVCCVVTVETPPPQAHGVVSAQ